MKIIKLLIGIIFFSFIGFLIYILTGFGPGILFFTLSFGGGFMSLAIISFLVIVFVLIKFLSWLFN